MARIDVEFAELCRRIQEQGSIYEDKSRGVKRLQIPSYTFRHYFSDGFPAVTNKKLFWKGVVGELLWFLRGDNDVEYLNDNGIKIWNKDAWNWHKKTYSDVSDFSEAEFCATGRGSVGQNYSVQWRNYNGNTDQIKNLITEMKENIMSTRLKVNAWNPSEINLTALPPCHSEFQVIGVPLGNDQYGFELHWTQRSVDTFLGLPFNIASYGTLAQILEKITGYKAIAIEGNLKCVHFYDNQFAAVDELLKRDPSTHDNCALQISPADIVITAHNLDEMLWLWNISDFKLIGYTSDDSINVEMLAPKEC